MVLTGIKGLASILRVIPILEPLFGFDDDWFLSKLCHSLSSSPIGLVLLSGLFQNAVQERAFEYEIYLRIQTRT